MKASVPPWQFQAVKGFKGHGQRFYKGAKKLHNAALAEEGADRGREKRKLTWGLNKSVTLKRFSWEEDQ